jgi:hypothetical protein
VTIRKTGGKFVVKSESGKKIGTFKSKGAAKKACQRAAMFGAMKGKR